MGGQLLDTSRCHHVFFCFPEVCSIPRRVSSSWVCCWSVWKLKRLRHCRSRRDGMSNAWARRRRTRPMNLSQRNGGGGVGVVLSTNLDDVFGVGHVFVIFVGNFLEWWWMEWSVKKTSATKFGSLFFFNFSTVMPMRFYLHGDVRHLPFFFIGVFFNKTIGICCFFIFFRWPFKTTWIRQVRETLCELGGLEDWELDCCFTATLRIWPTVRIALKRSAWRLMLFWEGMIRAGWEGVFINFGCRIICDQFVVLNDMIDDDSENGSPNKDSSNNNNNNNLLLLIVIITIINSYVMP